MLYVVKLLYITKKKDNIIKREFISLQQTSNYWKNKTLSDYKKHLNNNINNYNINSCILGIYTDLNSAEKALINSTDYWLYNYAIIMEVKQDVNLIDESDYKFITHTYKYQAGYYKITGQEDKQIKDLYEYINNNI